jgi:hypothetical protein
MRLARSRIALDEQSGGEKFLEIDACRPAARIDPHIDLKRHCSAHGGNRHRRASRDGEKSCGLSVCYAGRRGAASVVAINSR